MSLFLLGLFIYLFFVLYSTCEWNHMGLGFFLSFFAWLISLSIVPLWSLQVVPNVNISFFYGWVVFHYIQGGAKVGLQLWGCKMQSLSLYYCVLVIVVFSIQTTVKVLLPHPGVRTPLPLWPTHPLCVWQVFAVAEAWEIQAFKKTRRYNTGTRRGPSFTSFMVSRPRAAGPEECVSIKQILTGFSEF